MNKNIPLNYLYRIIKNRPTVPRWIIFSLDLTICALSLVYAFLLRFNMDFEKVAHANLLFPILAVSALNVIFFRLFRTSEGIIRLSSAREGVRCVSAILCGSLVLTVSVVVSAIFKLEFIVPTSVLFIYFFMASFLIFSYRIMIRELYHRSLKARLTTENVIVFGEAVSGALLKKAIESIPGHQYKVVAFVDNNNNLWGMSIDTAKIYSWEQVKSITAKYNIEYLFLEVEDIEIDLKNQIADYCLVNNIAIKIIPAVQKWVNGQLPARQVKNLEISDLLNRPSIKLAAGHIKEFLSGKRILVTGAAGSIGSEIVKQLAAVDAEQLILCDNSETGLYELQHQLSLLECSSDNIVVRICNVRHRDIMENLFETYRPNIVFHAAAYKHVPLMEMHPCEAVMNNVLGSKVVADLALKYGVDRFVFVSTDKAINPTNIMGASKRIAEMYLCELHNNQMKRESEMNVFNDNIVLINKPRTKFITTRFGNVLGSNGSVIPRFQEQLDMGGPITVTHPDIRRFFMTIPEACSLVLEAGTMGKGGEIFVFDMGEPIKIIDLATKMIKLAGLVPGKDIQIDFVGLRPGEKLYEEVLNNSEEVIKTHHKKIMISRVNNGEIDNIAGRVDNLINLAAQSKNFPVVKQMKLIVREFKSKNSIYEKLDGEAILDAASSVA